MPRLGIATMEELKCNMLRLIRDSNQPKYKILAGGLWRAVCGSGSNTERAEPSNSSGISGAVNRYLLAGRGNRRTYTGMVVLFAT